MAGVDITAFLGLMMMGPEFYQKAKDLFVWHGMNSKEGPDETTMKNQL